MIIDRIYLKKEIYCNFSLINQFIVIFIIFFLAGQDFFFMVLLLIYGFCRTAILEKPLHQFINWRFNFNIRKNFFFQELIFGSVKRRNFSGRKFNYIFTIKILFRTILIRNLLGLNIYFNQLFIGKLSISLIVIAIGF